MLEWVEEHEDIKARAG